MYIAIHVKSWFIIVIEREDFVLQLLTSNNVLFMKAQSITSVNLHTRQDKENNYLTGCVINGSFLLF